MQAVSQEETGNVTPKCKCKTWQPIRQQDWHITGSRTVRATNSRRELHVWSDHEVVKSLSMKESRELQENSLLGWLELKYICHFDTNAQLFIRCALFVLFSYVDETTDNILKDKHGK